MALKVNQISKHFGEKQVLNQVSFTVQKGKALGLLGRNGAGKTTSIRIIMGVLPSDGGNIELNGKPFERGKVRIGYLPEERGMYPKEKILNQLVYFGELKGIPPRQAKASAMRLLNRMQMAEHAHKTLDTLSKGNQQKIQLALTLIDDPDIVILDEPFSGLDPVNAMLLKDMVLELIQNDKIVLFSSHQMNYIEEFCDDIAVIHQGEIVLSGSIQEIKRGYDRRIIEVQSPDAQAVFHVMKQQQPDWLAGLEYSGQRLTVTLKHPQDKAQLIRHLSEQQLDIDSFQVYEPSLSDIFVEYTGDEPPTAAGQGQVPYFEERKDAE